MILVAAKMTEVAVSLALIVWMVAFLKKPPE